jgi:Concanavalin A-like lectin/glucanases superfamily
MTEPPDDATKSDALSEPAEGGAAGVAERGPGARRRMGRKSAWTLGGIIAVAGLAVVLSAAAKLSLSDGSTSASEAAATSPASPSVTDSAKQVPGVAPTPTPTGKHSPGRAGVAPSVVPGQTLVPETPAMTLAPGTPGTAVTPVKPAAPNQPAVPGKPARVVAPKPVGAWPLNDDDPASTARDTAGPDPATGHNTAWCTTGDGNCATFNGTSSAFTTPGPVLATGRGKSFTVSAMVYMTALSPDNGSETIVSQDGTYDSGFYLQYSGADHRWAFARVVSDTDQGPAGIRALSTSGPTLYTWTHLVGVYDASDDQLRLYVNDVLEGTVTDSAPFAATGPLAIGRAQFDGQPTDWYNGAADQIKVYNRALTSAQVAKIPL